jgi:hypothetical protein
MIRILVAAGLLAVAFAGSANAQALRAVSMLNGNETIVVSPNIVKADCTSDTLPDVRMIGQAANGVVRIENGTVTVNRVATDVRAHCNGKRVEGINVFYKANPGFVGVERIILKTDFRDGTVNELVILVDVR